MPRQHEGNCDWTDTIDQRDERIARIVMEASITGAVLAAVAPSSPVADSRPTDDESEIEQLRAEVARVRSLIAVDRTGLAAALDAVRRIARGHEWLADPEGGTGSYTYEEWGEAAIRREVNDLITRIDEAALNALKASGDLADAAFRPPAPASSQAGGDGARCEECGAREFDSCPTHPLGRIHRDDGCGHNHPFQPAAPAPAAGGDEAETRQRVRDTITSCYHSYSCPACPPNNDRCTCGLSEWMDEYDAAIEAAVGALREALEKIADEKSWIGLAFVGGDGLATTAFARAALEAASTTEGAGNG